MKSKNISVKRLVIFFAIVIPTDELNFFVDRAILRFYGALYGVFTHACRGGGAGANRRVGHE